MEYYGYNTISYAFTLTLVFYFICTEITWLRDRRHYIYHLCDNYNWRSNYFELLVFQLDIGTGKKTDYITLLIYAIIMIDNKKIKNGRHYFAHLCIYAIIVIKKDNRLSKFHYWRLWLEGIIGMVNCGIRIIGSQLQKE